PVAGTWISEKIIVGTFFNGGVRAFDLSDPFHPTEVAYAVPPAPRKSRFKAIQINDVFVDDRGVLFAVDRIIGGLYAYEFKMESDGAGLADQSPRAKPPSQRHAVGDRTRIEDGVVGAVARNLPHAAQRIVFGPCLVDGQRGDPLEGHAAKDDVGSPV